MPILNLPHGSLVITFHHREKRKLLEELVVHKIIEDYPNKTKDQVKRSLELAQQWSQTQVPKRYEFVTVEIFYWQSQMLCKFIYHWYGKKPENKLFSFCKTKRIKTDTPKP